MWQVIMKLLVKAAVWAAEHPDQVKAAVDAVAAAKSGK